MKVNRVRYAMISLAVIVVTAYFFIDGFRDFRTIFTGKSALQIVAIVLTAALIHLIKASRLYLTLYGSNLRGRLFVKTYCMVTPVSIVLPYKLGEFFRMYCFGMRLRNITKGIITILLDRTMDTMALITIIMLVRIFNGGHISAFTYVLLLFLIFVVMVYFAFPGVYHFWKKYFLRAKATERRLSFLHLISVINDLYLEITGITKGRGIILYSLSLVAWILEIGTFALLEGAAGNSALNDTISGYLSAVMGNGAAVQLQQFIVISVLMTTILYAAIKGYELLAGKK